MTVLRRSRSLFFTTAALAGFSFAGVVASADTGTGTDRAVEVLQVVVDFSDLDLDTDRGAAVLQRRLRAAAREVCGSPDPRELALAQRARACGEAAITRAVDQVGSPRLAKLHAARSRASRG